MTEEGLAMPSPFPGMNPYLEKPDSWVDFHERFVPHLSETIEQALPEPYRTRIDENIYIHELSAEERRLIGRPDVHVASPIGLTATSNGALTTSPAMAGVPEGIEILELTFLEILDKRNNRVVTTIELLSPSNKDNGGDAEVYRVKVAKLMRSTSHFVELDFLRAGQRTDWRNLTPCDYSVVVSRASERPKVGHWPIGLRDRLPEIPIPLLPGDADVMVDLQAVLHRVYDSARYGRYIYREEIEPPLREEDKAWAAAIVAGASTT